MRQAAVLFLAAGAVGFLSDLLPGGIGFEKPIALVLDGVTLGLGVAMWTLSGFRSLHGTGSLVLPLLAFSLIGVNSAENVAMPGTHGIWFVLVMLWVGIWHSQRVVLAMAPFAIAAYLVPFGFGALDSSWAIPSVFVVVPIAILTGEVVALNAAGVRRERAQREQLLADMTREALTDPLTGVGNRRAGDMLIASLTPNDVVVMLDLDRFKDVNDTFGHLEGDRVLSLLSAHLRSGIRDRDAVARMGGEEFMLVLRDAATTASALTDRLLEGWRLTKPRTTFSAGIAVHRHGVPGTATYAAADSALYEAKRLGRDRAVLGRAGKMRHAA